MEIRKAIATDIPAIMAIIEQTWEPTYKAILGLEQVRFMQAEIYNPASLAAQMAQGQEFFILYDARQPAGFASCSPQAGGAFKLNKLYVAPVCQGKNFGRLLIAHIEAHVRRQGGSSLMLHVNRFNKARTFYEKLGYRVIREEDIPIGDFWMNDYVLEKAL